MTMQTYTTNNDADYIMDVQAEERGYQEWLRKQKTHILSIHDAKKKQKMWSKIFPPYEPSNIPF